MRDRAAEWQKRYAASIKRYNALVDNGNFLSSFIPGWWNIPQPPLPTPASPAKTAPTGSVKR